MKEAGPARGKALGWAALAVLSIGAALAGFDTAVALLRGWRPLGLIEHAGLAGIVSGLLAVGLLILLRPPRLHRWGGEVLLAAGGAIAALLLLETGAAIIEPGFHREAPFHTRGRNLVRHFSPQSAFVSGITGSSTFTTNAAGFRVGPGNPARAGCRVLCVGGSTTECVYLDDSETWPALAAAGLHNVWMGNAGISGFATPSHVRFLKDSRDARTMDGFVFMLGINDMWRYLSGETEHTRFNRFNTEEAGDSGEAPPSAEPVQPLWARSRLIQLWHTLRGRFEDSTDPSAAIQVESSNGAEYAIRRARRAEAPKTGQLPPLEEGLAAYRARVLELIGLCKRRGQFAVFATQPVLWPREAGGIPAGAAELCWFGWLEDDRYLTLPALRRAMDAYNEVLVRVCAENGVPCADLASLHARPEFFYDDCHFTEAGARAVAERIAPLVKAACAAK